MSVHITEEQRKKAEKFVEKIHAHGDLAPLDLVEFWKRNALAVADPWNCEQLPLGMSMSPQCMFEEINLEMDWYRLLHDHQWRGEAAKRYNDLAEKIVGVRILNESILDPAVQLPSVKELHHIFESENKWETDSYWLPQSANTPSELEALLDRVEKRIDSLREFMLPENWEEEKRRVLSAGGKIPLYRRQRGPVTFAMSIYGVENLIFLIMDEPDLADRFSQLILRALLERARILDEEAGFTTKTVPHGFRWLDDNCAMLNEEMYRQFGFPIIKGVFDRYAADTLDERFQHSDSDMGHLLPALHDLDMRDVNLGPNLTIIEIREQLPKAIIRGQLAPFTFSRNEEVNMVAEVIRDAEMAREKKGVIFSTAGSVNYGSRLSGLRLVMAAIGEFGQFE